MNGQLTLPIHNRHRYRYFQNKIDIADNHGKAVKTIGNNKKELTKLIRSVAAPSSKHYRQQLPKSGVRSELIVNRSIRDI